MALTVIIPQTQAVIRSNYFANSRWRLLLRGNCVECDVNGNIGTSLQVTAGTGLSVNVNTGYAYVAGVEVYNDASVSLSVPASSTSYVYIHVLRNAQDQITGVEFVVSTVSTLDTDFNYMKLASVVTDANNVTSITDLRRSVLNALGGVRYWRIETTTSVNKTFVGAKALLVYARLWAGGGSGGASRVNADQGYAGGGQGGGYLEEIHFVQANNISITIGAGGSAVTVTNTTNIAQSGNAGGNSSITIGSITRTVAGGSGGNAGTSIDSQTVAGADAQSYMHYVNHAISPLRWDGSEWKVRADGTVYGTLTVLYVGGSGGSVLRISGTTGYLLPRQISLSGGNGGTYADGGTIGESGAVPGGGGGGALRWNAGSGTSASATSGAGAGGKAIVEVIVFYSDMLP